VTSSLRRTTLLLEGDDLGASLVIGTVPNGLSARGLDGISVTVTPLGGTTLDGSPDPKEFAPVENIKVTFGDGANTLLVGQISLPGDLTYAAPAPTPSKSFRARSTTTSRSRPATDPGPSRSPPTAPSATTSL
jgi:hypothetical protein